MRTMIPSICRFCPAMCGMLIHIENERVVKAEGDHQNPLFKGFSCPKGRAAPAQLYSPQRLLQSLKRKPDGSYEAIPTAVALDEIAAKLEMLIRDHGPRSVAVFLGGYLFIYSEMLSVGMAFQKAIGTPMLFHNGTIDQPGKKIAAALHGKWAAGRQPFESSDVWMLIATNPIVSQWGGIPPNNPAQVLKDRLAAGMKLVVIDPRRTDVARAAHIHLQPKPGEDSSILAAMIRIILEERLFDTAFAEAEVQGLEDLRRAVDRFTPAFAARRADVPAEQISAAARMFAAGKRGCVTGGTGINMAPHGSLTEYLVLVLNSICGRWMRAGERYPNPLAYLPAPDPKAQPLPKQKPWGFGAKMRVRDLEETVAGVPTAALAEEILMPGSGQIKALLLVAANPVVAWPDQARTMAALRHLELSVTMDVHMSATAKLCDYIIASTLSYETAGNTKPGEVLAYGYGMGWERPYAQHTPALVPPPQGSDVIHMWEFYYGLAQRLKLQLVVDGVPLDMKNTPTTEELLDALSARSRIDASEIKSHPHGYIFEAPDMIVRPRDPGFEERLDVGNAIMLRELEEYVEESGTDSDSDLPYRLVSMRLRNVFNSTGQHLPELRQPHNPALMNEEDAQREGLKAGDLIEIRSDHGAIRGIVQTTLGLRCGVISMSHGFGDATLDDEGVRSVGSPTGRLIPTDRHFDPVTGIPRMSAVPVSVRRL